MITFLLLSTLGWNTTCAVDFRAKQCDCFDRGAYGEYYDGYRKPKFHSPEPLISQDNLDDFLQAGLEHKEVV